MQEHAVVVSSATGPTLAFVVAQWLHAKHHRTGSERTRDIYRTTIEDFRHRLRLVDADLDSMPQVVASVAQVWAYRSADGRREVSGSTANQRLAIVSSFYAFAQRQGYEVRGQLIDNPMVRVQRAKVERYAHAQALTPDDVHAALDAIDRATLIGKRDYALILVALETGQRLNVLRNLDRGHMTFRHSRAGWSMSVMWPRAKGGKQMRNTLGADSVTPQAMREWLTAYYGDIDAMPADAPVWMSLSPFHPHGRISVSAMAYICGRRIGTTKVHTLRHTFAHGMDLVGAPVSEIKARLGHASLDTTGRYLDMLRSDENQYIGKLEELYGVKRKQDTGK